MTGYFNEKEMSGKVKQIYRNAVSPLKLPGSNYK